MGSKKVDLVSKHQPVQVVSKVMPYPSTTINGKETKIEMKNVKHHVTRFVYNVNCSKRQIEALLGKGNSAKWLGCPKKVRIINNKDADMGEFNKTKWLHKNKTSKCAVGESRKTTAANDGKTDYDKVKNAKAEVFAEIKSESKDFTSTVSNKNDRKCQVRTIAINELAENLDSRMCGNTDCKDIAKETVLIYDVNSHIDCDKFLASIAPNSMLM